MVARYPWYGTASRQNQSHPTSGFTSIVLSERGRMPLLGGGGAVRSVEALRVHELLPRLAVAVALLGKIECPRGVADLFPHAGETAVFDHGLEKLVLGVPVHLLEQLAQLGGLGFEL